MPEAAVRQFVKRLNLTYRLPARILDDIRQCLPEQAALRIKVRLRNAAIDFSDRQADLMAELLTKMDVNHPDFWNCLDFLLGIMAEIAPDTHIHDLLTAKKIFYLSAVERSEQFLEKLRRSNIETLMQLGQRAAFIHPEEGRKRMEVIDLICRTLFGQSERIGPVRTRTINLNSADPDEQMNGIISFLS